MFSTRASNSDSESDLIDSLAPSLKFIEKLGYAFGHIFNDLCAAVWFSFTLLFLEKVQQMSQIETGALILLGQITQAIVTPVIGKLSDVYGSKRTWHAVGTLFVFLSFPLIYSVCPYCDVSSGWKLTFYVVIVIIFNVAWPMVQIAHMAIIPELGSSQRDRSDLTAMRYTGLISSAITVYVVTSIVLGQNTDNKLNAKILMTTHAAQADENIQPTDGFKFRDISLILTLIGCVTTVLFQFSLQKSNYNARRQELEVDESQPLIGSGKKNFFKRLEFYQNLILYVTSRMFMTIALVYIPSWIEASGSEIANSSLQDIARVSLVSFIGAFIISIIFKFVLPRVGNWVGFLAGCIIGMTGCALMHFLTSLTILKVYFISIFYGMAHSMMIISSLSSIAHMIGSQAGDSGVVYSAVTFFDKLSTGIVVFVIQALKPNDNAFVYFRHVLAFGGAASVIFGVVVLATKCKSR